MKAPLRQLVPAILLVTFSSLVISCTKEVPYKYEYKEKVHAKSEIDTKAEYMYVPSSDLTNHADLNTAGAIPYWQGQERLVKFRFTEKSLQAVEVDDEARLQDNKTNERVAFEIPISHIEYRCAEDRYKKCTNREEENNEIPWNKKSQFKPDFESMKPVGVSLLPIEMDQVFGTSCFTETSSRFVSYELSGDALNVQVEKVFSGDATCLEKKGIQITKMGDLQSQIIYHYSFTKLKTIASPGYKPVDYPNADESRFGYFTTETRKYDAGYNRTEKLKKQLMSRWSPDRGVIEYYLTDNFDKPEYAAIKKATETAFERVNTGLATAGVDLKLVLKGTGHKSPGDIRNSMIVLVEDPIAGGPLGYGPSAVNPRTGEIMSSRVAMYYGNMLAGIRYTYDEVVRDVKHDKQAAVAKTSKLTLDPEVADAKVIANTGAGASAEKSVANKAAAKEMKARLAKIYAKEAMHSHTAPTLKTHSSAKTRQWTPQDIAKLDPKKLNRMLLASDKKSTAKDALSAMSKYCNYPSELFPFNNAVRTGLQKVLGQDLKPWKDLSEDEKQKVIALIAPEVWTPILIHELGHNLGLRHNFGGSEDKDNFYSKEELNKMGVTHKVQFSSVMDYGYSELNLLPTLGKYDIAALRFGYKREIELKDSKIMQLNDKTVVAMEKEATANSKTLEFKEYQYCSDEHVDVNPNCKRFDEGTTAVEMVAFAEKAYEELYQFRNFRNGRENFSLAGDLPYATYIRNTFGYLRSNMERYEKVANLMNISPYDENWDKISWLKDIKDAARLSGEFFLKVLKTPDVQCALAKKDNPTVIVEIGDLSAYAVDGGNCFEDAELDDQYIVVGQTGKAFNNKKSTLSENSYADQIDVRGIYIDKIVAMENLFYRRTGNVIYDRLEDNYMDTDLMQDIMTTMSAILMNKSYVDATFKNAAGEDVITMQIRPNMFNSPGENAASHPVHWIDAPVTAEIAQYLGLPNRNMSFQEKMLSIIKEGTTHSQARTEDARMYMDFFSVIKTNTAYKVDRQLDAVIKDIGSIRYIATGDNMFAGMSMNTISKAELLNELSEEDLKQFETELKAIAEAKKQVEAFQDAFEGSALQESSPVKIPELSDKFSEDYKQITYRDLQDFKNGYISLEKSNFLLSIMPASN